MSVPTMLNIIRRDWLKPLKAIGRYDWLAWTPVEDTNPRTRFRLALPDDCDPQFRDLLQTMARSEPIGVFKMFAQ